MLSSKAKLFLNSRNSVRLIFSANFSTPQKFSATPEDSSILVEKVERQPFMKNIFLGIVDQIFLQYPEPKSIEPSKNVQKLLDDISNSLTGKDLSTYEKFKVIVECGFLKCKLPEVFGGIDMTNSEVLNLYEELKFDPSLSLLLETQCSLILQTILNHGSDRIKQEYLTRVISGELSGAYAMSEEGSGSDPASIKTIAKEEDDCFRLSGEKIWVTNAENADFFIVFANNIIENKPSMIRDLSVFLVDKKDISLEKHNLLGLNDCGLCKIKFNNVRIPKYNLIGKMGDGYQIAGDGLRYHKYIILIAMLNHLKYYLSSTISYIHERKQFPIDLKDCELVKNKLMKITSAAYTFESMLYFTSGISDHYVIDDTLESAILQLFGFENGLEAISLCMNQLGSRAYDVSFPFESLWRDLKGLSLCTKTVDIIRLYISLTGIDHAGNNLKDVVVKNRNPFNFPGFAFKKVVNNTRHAKDKPKLHLKLYMNLHPRLKPASEHLEYCILRLQYVIEILLSRHGAEVIKRQLELKRIAEIARDIYAMVAVISRASRSYCTGVQFCDQEVAMATSICYNNFIRVKRNVNNILHPEKKLSDVYSIDIGSHIINNNLYSFVHPLKPTIV